MDTRICQNPACGNVFNAKRMQCPQCRRWQITAVAQTDRLAIPLKDVQDRPPIGRYLTGPWDAAFGNGAEGNGTAKSGLYMMSGAPGAGKTTLAMKWLDQILSSVFGVGLYLSAEQSREELRDYAKKVGVVNTDRFLVVGVGDTFDLGHLMTLKPVAYVKDSLAKIIPDVLLHEVYLGALKEYTVKHMSPGLVLNHVTKSADVAGLMKSQHHVDAVLTLYPKEVGAGNCPWCEDETCAGCERELFTEKNRFGKAQIATRLIMTGNGLVAKEQAITRRKR
jgi:predicted ATP-dependent serine protease